MRGGNIFVEKAEFLLFCLIFYHFMFTGQPFIANNILIA